MRNIRKFSISPVIVFLSFLIPFVVRGEEIATDTITSNELEEVVVKGRKSIDKGEYVMLFLSKENENFGTNALDAISSLNRFSMAVNESLLRNNQGMEVYVLIDGVPSNPDVLRSLKGVDIRRVDYYEIPPARFRGLTSQPIANVILRRRHDYLVNANIQASTLLNSAQTNDNASILYRDSLNMARVAYSYFFQNLHHVDYDNLYEYPSIGISHVTGTDSRNKNITHNVSAAYQRFQGRHLFNSQFSFQWASMNNETPFKSVFTVPGSEGVSEGRTISALSSKPILFNLDLYYNYDLTPDRHLYVDLVTSYGHGKRSYFFSQELNDSPQGTSNPDSSIYEYFQSESEDDTHTTSVKFVGGYSQPLIGGNFSASIRNLFSEVDNHFRTGIAPMSKLHSRQNETQGNVGMSWYKGIGYISPSLGLTYTQTAYEDNKIRKLTPYAFLTAQLIGQGKCQGLYATLQSYLVNNDPRIGNTVSSYNFVDRYYVSAGNPDLKGSTYNETSLNLQYYAPSGRDFVSLYFANQHNWNGTGTVVTQRDGLIVSQLSNIGHTNNWLLQAYGRWNPVAWLYLSPSASICQYNHSTPHSDVNKTTWSVGGNIMGVWRGWYLTLSAERPRETVNGDFVSTRKLSFGASLTWTIKGWSLSGTWYRGGRSVTECVTPIFYYKSIVNDRSMRNYLNLTVTYSFSKGRARRHGDKSVSLPGGDTGLRD